MAELCGWTGDIQAEAAVGKEEEPGGNICRGSDGFWKDGEMMAGELLRKTCILTVA